MDQVFVLYDRDSDSIWYPLSDSTLDAVGGSRRGQSIEILEEPAPRSLGEWLDAHPDSTVLLPSERDLEYLERRQEHERRRAAREDSGDEEERDSDD